MSYSFVQRSLLALSLLALLAPTLAAAAPSDKQLQRQRGSVKYRDKGGVTHQVAAQVVVPDDATAITDRASAAMLQLPDSSEVALGENTSVQVGAFNAYATTGNPNKITVNSGALNFAIRHPSGAKSNYTFATPTSQIAVRGTEGYLVVGPNGTQVVCTRCEPGDVTVTTIAGVVTALVTGQVLTVLGNGAAASTSVSTLSTFNNPAVNQFSTGLNPFGNGAASADVTGSASGATASAASATAAAGGATVGAVAGGAVVTGVGVSALTSTTTTPAVTIALAPNALSFTTLQTTQTFTFSGASSASATSSNPSVATVSGPSGNTFTVTSVGAGTATIMVSSGTSSANLQVTVTGTVIQPQRKH